jgi:hypothetical protein
MSDSDTKGPIPARAIAYIVVCCLLAGAVWLMVSPPGNPVAIIQVVDAAGRPISGAVITPEGLRTKPGPYVSGWYVWMTSRTGVSNNPVITDKAGYALVPYPKYVFEHIETGVIIASVAHPDYASDRPERTVTTAPPSGAPWQAWRDYVWDRVRRKTVVVRPDPVILQKGAILKLSVKPDSLAPRGVPLFAQVSAGEDQEADFWTRPEPGVLITHRLASGPQTIRAVEIEASGAVWFSDVIRITAVPGQTNEVVVDLKRGAALHGQLDAVAPRPVRNGRVVVHVWPQGHRSQDSPPQWHAWSNIRQDGTFDLSSLPEGNLEVVVLCDGFVSTNGPGMFKMVYPQKHVLGTNDLAITVGMMPAARLEVYVTDDKGKPLAGAHVSTWPNVRYGEWSATILASDCYNTSDQFLSTTRPEATGLWRKSVPDFEGISDSAGLAVIPNLPATVTEFGVEHPRFALPAVKIYSGEKRRQMSITLRPGETNHVSVQLEPRDQSPIAHY